MRFLITLLLLCAPVFAEPAKLAPLKEVAPLAENELEESIKRGVDYLIGKQNKDGSWGGPTRTKGLNIYAPVPEAHLAFRSGASALALAGLLDSKDQRPETKAAIERGEKWFFEKLPKLRHVDPTTTYNVWGHSYGLRAISRLYKYREGDEAKRSRLKQLAELQFQMLLKTEDVRGGWGYLDFDGFTSHFSGIPTCFTTATVLLAMKDAEETMGITPPAREVKRGLRSIEQQKTADWSFTYSIDHRLRPRYGINRPAGSLGRTQVCFAAMRRFGDERITDELIQHWLHRLCLLMLQPEDQKKFIPHLARHILSKQEKDGSWWDYPLYDYHQPYGTGYALTTLSRLRDSVAK